MRARRRSNDGARLLFGEAAFLGDVLALPAATSEAGLPVFAAFGETPGRTALGLGAKALARPEPLGAAFCIRRRGQSQNQRRSGAEPGAHKREAFAFLPPHSTKHARKR